jgi:Raf kinase inhibitor-like protein, YbhB/YbcL family
MIVRSKGIVNGIIKDEYGSKGRQFTKNGMPSFSLPLEISEEPKGTRSFAIVMEDLDAIPVCGFSWIHWTVSDLQKDILEDNESVNGKFTQGVNSYHSVASKLSKEEATGYGGPAPPDREHRYSIKVFALDTVLKMKNGFYMNDLYKEMEGHILAHGVLTGLYSPE